MDTVQIPVNLVQDALDAMSWTFAPYLEEPGRLTDRPYLVELVLAYNSMLMLLPEPFRSQYREVAL